MRAEALALLRLAALDAEMDRLRGLVREILALIEKQRSDLQGLAAVIEGENTQLAKSGSPQGELALVRQRRVEKREASYAELARTDCQPLTMRPVEKDGA